MARRNDVSTKTVLRAYWALRDQGLVEVRAGSGAIVGGETVEHPEEEQALALVRMARRQRAEAMAAGLTPRDHRLLLSRLDGDGVAKSVDRRSQPRLVFLECNGELATISAREITRRLNVQTFPLVLPAADASSEAIMRMADLWLTTDFHFQELRPRANHHRCPCVTLRLDPRFSQTILQAAARGSVLMVHPDPSIVPAFKLVLADAGAPKEMLDRIKGVAAGDLDMVRREIASADFVYVSPLCSDEVRMVVPRKSLLPVPKWMIATSSIEALRAMLLTLPFLSAGKNRRGPSTERRHSRRPAGRDGTRTPSRGPRGR